jgi:hypothetical protein
MRSQRPDRLYSVLPNAPWKIAAVTGRTPGSTPVGGKGVYFLKGSAPKTARSARAVIRKIPQTFLSQRGEGVGLMAINQEQTKR